jgi:hypothetical protein
MKNILKLSLAAAAIAALAACGDSGGNSDAAEIYVGTWKSVCFSYVDAGRTLYTQRVRTLDKASAAELTSVIKYETAYSDAACKNSVGNYTANSEAERFNIGPKTTFLGRQVDALVLTELPSGAAISGYIVADSKQMLIVTYKPGETPNGWGIYSPYTKQ